MSLMLERVPPCLGDDCCEEFHTGWELISAGETKHGRNILIWQCAGCPHTEVTETYRDQYGHAQYADPDGVLIEFEKPRRKHRR